VTSVPPAEFVARAFVARPALAYAACLSGNPGPPHDGYVSNALPCADSIEPFDVEDGGGKYEPLLGGLANTAVETPQNAAIF
jgi:hypothetical protein